ncbi:MAG: DNA alkylation repair protein [Muribaculaceae bacterium]|nr:DNA alkylation repair protein [Muribaculaceae bacterium]
MTDQLKNSTISVTPDEVITSIEALRNNEQRQVLMQFFKTGPGEYGEGDEFLGLRVPQTRQVAERYAHLPLEQVSQLLASQWHEVRLCGLLIWVRQFERLSKNKLIDDEGAMMQRDRIISLYLQHAERANNWDLVDLSAPKLVGHWLTLPTALGGGAPGLHLEHKVAVLDALACSDNLWRQRISMVCTWAPTHQGDPRWCLRYAEQHLTHPHDLMHKAVGWMLREMGKCVSENLLRDFLQRNIHTIPATTLRYAIERLPQQERQQWLNRRRQG